MKFRPCIDLHQGKVKQIVGTTLTLKNNLKVNFVSDKSAAWFAKLYQKHGLTDGHIIRLGPNNDQNCLAALQAYPNGFRVGGGITLDNAIFWLDHGASAVIVTSYIFSKGRLNFDKLTAFKKLIGQDKLIIDLSSAPDKDGQHWIYLGGWQKKSNEKLTSSLLAKLKNYCSGFIVHSIKQEGMAKGVNAKLLEFLGQVAESPVVYAGGVSSKKDLAIIKSAGKGLVDFTVGSALDIFGGQGLTLTELARDFC